MTTTAARVEVLTAEVRVLMVGSRQVTMSVYNQLDTVAVSEIEPFGRVAPRDAGYGEVYIVGASTRDADRGTLVRSSRESGAALRHRAQRHRRCAALIRERHAVGQAQEQASEDVRQIRDAERRATLARLDAGLRDLGFDHDEGLKAVSAWAGRSIENLSDLSEYETAYVVLKRVDAIRGAAGLPAEQEPADAGPRSLDEAIYCVRELENRLRDLSLARDKEFRPGEREWTASQFDGAADELDAEAARAAEWEALPLIVLAGLR